MDSIPQKKCTGCKQLFPRTTDNFYSDKRAKDGLYSCCKSCFLIRAKKWRDKDVEHARAVALASYYKHHPKRLVAGKRYREADPQRWYKKNDRWAKNNPDKVRAKTLRHLALKNNAEGNHTESDVSLLYSEQEGRCAYCGITLHSNYHVDHIHPLSKGGSNWPDNLAITCGYCNDSKADKMLGDWMVIRGW